MSARNHLNPQPAPSSPRIRPCAPIPELRSCRTLCTLLQRSEPHPVTFQSFARSLQKHRGIIKSWFSTFSILLSLAVTPLGATLTADLRVLTEISRNQRPASPLDATLIDFAPVTPLSATLTRTRGDAMLPHRHQRFARPGVPCIRPYPTASLLHYFFFPSYNPSAALPASCAFFAMRREISE